MAAAEPAPAATSPSAAPAEPVGAVGGAAAVGTAHASEAAVVPPPPSAAATAGEPDMTFKLILVGESNAGKSSLLQHFVHGRMNAVSKHTVGVEFGSRTIALATGGDDASGGASRASGRGGGGTAIVKLHCWDTAGQDRFRSMTRSYYRGAVGALVVFSLADRESFNKLPQWLGDVRSQSGPDVVVVLVGNKADLGEERQVTLLEASKLAQTEGCVAYVETSALTGENVDFAFLKLARSVLVRVQEGRLDAAALTMGTAVGKGGAGAVGLAGGGGAAGGDGGGCAC